MYMRFIYVTMCKYINIWEIYYKELAHVITEAEKSQDLQSKDLRTRRADGLRSSLSLKAENT